MRKNANEIIFDEIIVLGTPALFTDWRVDRTSVPTDTKIGASLASWHGVYL